VDVDALHASLTAEGIDAGQAPADEDWGHASLGSPIPTATTSTSCAGPDQQHPGIRAGLQGDHGVIDRIDDRTAMADQARSATGYRWPKGSAVLREGLEGRCGNRLQRFPERPGAVLADVHMCPDLAQ
jgi:hypothetical protein